MFAREQKPKKVTSASGVKLNEKLTKSAAKRQTKKSSTVIRATKRKAKKCKTRRHETKNHKDDTTVTKSRPAKKKTQSI